MATPLKTTLEKNEMPALGLSVHEIEKFRLSLENPEFRSLLVDYSRELRDGRVIYEREMMELDPTIKAFLHPTPGFVIQILEDGNHDLQESKVFVNICYDEAVEEAVHSGRGHWNIPYSVSPPRKDVDDKKEGRGISLIYDVVFNPQVEKLSRKNGRFKGLVKSTAVEGIQKIDPTRKLNQNSIKVLPKISYKGRPHPTVIRKENKVPDNVNGNVNGKVNVPKNTSDQKEEVHPGDNISKKSLEPRYILKYVDHSTEKVFDPKRDPTIPEELILEVDLPKFKSANGVDLDVTENSLTLSTNSPKEYNLNMNLPYSVDEDRGSAKFDKSTSKLVVTLPVKRPTNRVSSSKTHVDRLISTDSGIEADLANHEDYGDLSDLETSVLSDDVINTPKSSEDEIKLLKASHSSIVFNDVITFTLDVKNVNPNSVIRTPILNGSSITFTSIGSGMVPFHYGFSFAFTSNDSHQQDPNTIEYDIDTWDNNMTITIPLKDSYIDYLIGITSQDMKLISQPSLSQLRMKNEKMKKSVSEELENTGNSKKTKKNSKKNCSSSGIQHSASSTKTAVKDSDGVNDENMLNNRFVVTSLSDDVVSSIPVEYDSSTQEGLRGILKRRRHRCYSESQADQLQRWAAAAAAYSSNDTIDEEEEDDDSSVNSSNGSSKKSVRFNDVVQRQTFRQNGSILGMKHKNLKKAEARRRRNERRASEGDAASSQRNFDDDSGVASSIDDHDKSYDKGKGDHETENLKQDSIVKMNEATDLMFELDIE